MRRWATALLVLCASVGFAQQSRSARFFLPTNVPENVTEPTVETDAAGGVHTVYGKYAIGDAFYTYCPASCATRDQAKVVRLKTDGTVTNAMLALDSKGKPHALLQTASSTYYASCAADCTREANWKVTEILDLGFRYEVTGEAFALDAQDRPRFLQHGWISTFGPTVHETYYVACDRDCHRPASWTRSEIAQQAWTESQLRFDAKGRPRVATIVYLDVGGASRVPHVAFAQCDANCHRADAWKGGALGVAYRDKTSKNIDPAVSMALTRNGAPRVLALGADERGTANVQYLACDRDCWDTEREGAWSGVSFGANARLGSGVDLALDAADRPRAAFNLDDNVFVTSCESNCAAPNARWKDAPVELSRDMKADRVQPYPNCTIAAWFLRDPSIALGVGGKLFVAYRALDISGGFRTLDATKPPCTAGTDMTLARLTVLPAP